jgi:FkbM family methyltransferase
MLSTRNKIRIARALNHAVSGARRIMGRGPIAEVRRGGILWRLDLNEGVEFATYLGLYQRLPPQTWDWVRPGALVIDIGANIGAHALPITQAVGKAGRVVAIEPTDYAFTRLSDNIRLNPDLKGRIVPVHAALIDGSGESRQTKFYSRWPLHPEPHTDLHARHLGQLEPAGAARYVALDQLLVELRAGGLISGPARFVKLDVDGHELDVLRGGTRTFREDRPGLLIEIAPHVQDEVPQRFEDLIQALQEYGYRLAQANGQSLPQSAAGLRQFIRSGASIDA